MLSVIIAEASNDVLDFFKYVGGVSVALGFITTFIVLIWRVANFQRDVVELKKSCDLKGEKIEEVDKHLEATDAHQVEQDIRISKIETERRVEAEFSLKRASVLAREREKGLLRKRDDQ